MLNVYSITRPYLVLALLGHASAQRGGTDIARYHWSPNTSTPYKTYGSPCNSRGSRTHRRDRELNLHKSVGYAF